MSAPVVAVNNNANNKAIPPPAVKGGVANPNAQAKAVPVDVAPAVPAVPLGTGGFPAHAVVKVLGKGLIPMYMLQVGDEVEAYHIRRKCCCWSPVKRFFDRDPVKAVASLVLGYSHPLWGFGAITIGQDHMIYSADRGAMVDAKSIRIGERMLVGHDGNVMLVESTGSSPEMVQGLFNPITYSGTIIVDGVICSCFPGKARKLRSQNRKFARQNRK